MHERVTLSCHINVSRDETIPEFFHKMSPDQNEFALIRNVYFYTVVFARGLLSTQNP